MWSNTRCLWLSVPSLVFFGRTSLCHCFKMPERVIRCVHRRLNLENICGKKEDAACSSGRSERAWINKITNAIDQCLGPGAFNPIRSYLDFDSFFQSQNASGLFAPYNKPLNVLPWDGPIMVGQQSRSITEHRKSINFVLEFQVYWEERSPYSRDYCSHVSYK